MNCSDESLVTVMHPHFLALDEVVRERPNPAMTASRLKLHGLWCAGSLEGLARPTIAIVGSRAPTESGRRLAERFARDLGAAGACVISGLALGVDGSAHAGALAAGAPTIGVLGGGHRHFFPPRNTPLAGRMVESGGAVLSPYPPDAAARPFQFLQRNAIVAALADAVLVVEAATRSGALSTASWAAVSRTECLKFARTCPRGQFFSVRFSRTGEKMPRNQSRDPNAPVSTSNSTFARNPSSASSLTIKLTDESGPYVGTRPGNDNLLSRTASDFPERPRTRSKHRRHLMRRLLS